MRHTDADPGEFLAAYAQVVGIDAVDCEKAAEMLKKESGFSKEFFEQKCAKLNRALRNSLGLAATPYLIASIGQRPLTRYGLRLQEDEVEVVRE